jgi:hypothetical protein
MFAMLPPSRRGQTACSSRDPSRKVRDEGITCGSKSGVSWRVMEGAKVGGWKHDREMAG